MLSAKRSVCGEITLIQLRLSSFLAKAPHPSPIEGEGLRTYTGKVQVNRVSASSDATLNVPP